MFKGQITACGFVTYKKFVDQRTNRFAAVFFLWFKGQITACGFVTLRHKL